MRTFLFTDIEASTRRWEDDPAAMSAALARHDAIVRGAVEAHRGGLVKHTGDGVLAVFDLPADALGAAVAIVRGLGDDDVRVRAGLHTGPAEPREGDWFGPTLNRTARVMALGRGGHILLSATTAGAVGPGLPDGVTLLELGDHPLKGFEHPERIHQAVGDGLTTDRALDPGATSALAGRTSFVGREREIGAIERLLGSERCVTLTGVGGCGKTRLALEVARRRSAGFGDGVAVAELAPVADPGEAPRAVADAVAMPVVASALTRDLCIFLRERELLLVLDNCEHLLDACAELVEALVDACPRLTILATSREPLGIEGECSWRAPSLSLPDEGDLDPLACESAALFVARATSARPGLVPADHRDAIVSICRGLDGLPLAIELAAARTSHLTPEQIADMLAHRFRLLTGGTRRARQRQQTLAATMDWSHDLLSGDEQQLLRRLSVFAGGWTLDAAVAVAGEGDTVAVIDGLGSLVAKSLVDADETEVGMRYRMLETVRLYAQDRAVAADEATTLRDRHADWVLRHAGAIRAACGDRWISGTARAAEIELENLRIALDWSAEQDRGQVVVRIIQHTWPMWYLTIRSPEALAWLDRYASSVDDTLSTSERVEWRIARGFLLQEHMDGAAIAACGEEALGLDPDGVASDVTGLGWMLRLMLPVYVDAPEAVRLTGEALPWVAAHSTGDVRDFVIGYSANAFIAAREWEQARHQLLTITGGSCDEFLRRYAEVGLVTIALLTDQAEEARARAEELVATLEAAPGRHSDTTALALLAVTAAACGDRHDARAALDRTATTVRERYTHIVSAWGIPLTAAGAVLALEGRDAEAMGLLVAVGAGGRLWQARQEMLFVLHREYASTVAGRLGPEATARAWAEGDALDVAGMLARFDALVAEP